MYLRTPKRYSQRAQRRGWISLRWLWLWILTPVVIWAGVSIYNNRDQYTPSVQNAVDGLVNSAQSGLATASAPTALPTQDPAERIVLADSAWSRGAIEEALSIYQDVLDSAPNNVTVHYRTALGLVMDGRIQEGIEAAEQAVTANPFSSDAWAIRAMALDWNGQPQLAIASALQAIELDPENARAHAFLAEAYFDANQPDRALETVNKALELDPDSFEALRIRGMIVLNSQFDFASAKEDYDAAFSIAPNLPYLAIDLAQAYAALQDYDSATAILKDIVDLNPQNLNALYWLGFYYYSAYGDPNQASEYLTRCLDADPNNMNCNYYLGRVQIGLSDFTAASQSFETAVRAGSTIPTHFWWAGRAQVNLGNCPGAVQFLQTGYELAKQNTPESSIITDFEDLLRDCGSPVTGSIAEDNNAEVTPEVESDGSG